MTRDKLIELADNNPEELAFIFYNEFMKFYKVTEATDYLTDWTATINAIEKAGMLWVKYPDLWFEVIDKETSKNVRIPTKPNWLPCCALMICAIESKESKGKN